MARQPTVAEPILNGRALLYTRPDTGVYQVRFKIGRKWIHRSTGHKDKHSAIDAAFEIYASYKGLSDRGIQVTSKTFESIAKVVSAKLRTTGKTQDKTYANYLDNRWIPFFKGRYINNIESKDYDKFFLELEQKLNQKIKNITRRQHYVAINRVFDYSVEQKYLLRSEIADQPFPRDMDSKSDARPAFTQEEQRTLLIKLLDWIDKGETKRQKDKRFILYHYINILLMTGIRPGTESESITFGSVRKHTQSAVTIRVDGKTGERFPVAPVEILSHINSVKQTIKNATDSTPLLTLPSGKPYNDPQEDFKLFLTESGMLLDPMTNDERSLYSTRHSYISNQLLKGVSIYTIANQCGNSVAMIEMYYAKVRPLMSADAILGASNVDNSVPLVFD